MRNRLVLLALLAAVAACRPAPEPERSGAPAEYRSPTYGFSFRYPDSLDLRVYTPDHVALGRETPDGFDAAVEVGVFTAADDAPAAFEDFVADRARTLCAADGPGTALRCTDVQQRAPFETTTGVTGEVFYLKHETVDVAADRVTATDGRGPFFAFNVSANVPEARFAALIVRPPVTLDPAAVDSRLLRAVAASVRIDRVEPRGERAGPVAAGGGGEGVTR